MHVNISRSPVLLTGLIAIAFSSCGLQGSPVPDNGNSAHSERQVSGFTGVETRGDIDLVVSQGSFQVTVEADPAMVGNIETSVENSRLVVRYKDNRSIENDGSAKVYIRAPRLNFFEANGSGNIRSEGKITDSSSMNLLVAGSGDISLNLHCPEVKAESRGSGTIELQGEAGNIASGIFDSGDMKAGSLKTEKAKISVHGSGNTEVYASKSLDAEIFGSGDVQYKGSPAVTSFVHGSGKISKTD